VASFGAAGLTAVMTPSSMVMVVSRRTVSVASTVTT
jgi:hypothetical protein